MTPTLFMHPLASFCHKVLIALYENATPFEARIVDFSDEGSSAELLAGWPVGKIPVLRDEQRGVTIPETTVIIEYLEQHFPGPVRMIPQHFGAGLDVRLWDRFYDLYVSVPMQKIVLDRLRPDGGKDPLGVADARAMLQTAYGMADKHLADKSWACGGDFSMADCAAVPALFYAETLEPFTPSYLNLAAYYERLLLRPSVKRVLEEARPYFQYYPYKEKLSARFYEP